jgi:DNA-directed RNA polymerase subunit H (RpoH/RPB5)
VIPGDVVDLARDVLRHRIVPSFTALAEEVTADMILDRLIDAVPVPRVAHDGLLARAEAADRGALVGRDRPSGRADTFDRPEAFETFDRPGQERSA